MTEPTAKNNDLLTLALEGGDRKRQEVAERLRKMSADERRKLRNALTILDAALDEVQFAIHTERTRKRQLNGKDSQ